MSYITMAPAENFYSQEEQKFYDGYGSCGDSYRASVSLMSRLVGYEYCRNTYLEFDPMDEGDSMTSSVNEAGSSSKDAKEEKDEGWLQLGLGGGYNTSRTSQVNLDEADHEPIRTSSRSLLELELLPGGASIQDAKPLTPTYHVTEEFQAQRLGTISSTTTNINTPLLFQHPRATLSFPHNEVSWGYSPNPWNTTAPSSSSFSSVSSLGPYPRMFQHQNMGMVSPSSNVRIVDMPKRPQCGIWFVLEASQDQAKEPFLPQIPKTYLRIKDGRMTVKVLMKYLVNKLRLDSESEIEIACRGEKILPYMTLQHVRDNIWSRRDVITSLPDASTSDHVMILQYGRSA